ncbi:hypothetical protein M4D55_19470 [Metabacillus idriensis]|uniref:F510_1955 family glycosylhydrolase n=1 Tax=Metabacillus idriensis TaxID=324768 RepID=UPI0008AA493E|nr:hypothetical protein [Metabacillus idriensis]MCM3597952.1 hypothetical protein [Metabacillus idriensis]OHR73574.1 hypothetical protein HMPREF3291_18690 [Bacillus sp. HMSC76G11]
MSIFKNNRLIVLVSFVIIMLIAGITFLFNNKEVIKFEHIHGLGFAANEEIMMPAHDGIRIYKNNGWELSKNDGHDYMGFSIVENGFYSSGHPAQNSNLKNPFGIIKSDKDGSKLKPLALYGEVDFHGMAAGYYTNSIYVINSAPNSIMKTPGLYYSVDEAKNWEKSNAENLSGQASTIASHPSNNKIVAIGTDEGAYLSNDFGNRFVNVLKDKPVSALSFVFNEKLLIGSAGSKAEISILDLKTNDMNQIEMPKLDKKEFITFIANNPKQNDEIVFATSDNNIYLTKNLGEQWETIAKHGEGIKMK